MPGFQQLPPGLDPVTAGRFGLWLLGKRSHARAQKRTYRAVGVRGISVTGRLVNLILPWTVEEYPGYLRVLAEICGVSIRTVPHWINGTRPLPLKHCHTLLRIAEQHELDARLIAEELRRQISNHIAHEPKGFVKRRKRGG